MLAVYPRAIKKENGISAPGLEISTSLTLNRMNLKPESVFRLYFYNRNPSTILNNVIKLLNNKLLHYIYLKN